MLLKCFLPLYMSGPHDIALVLFQCSMASETQEQNLFSQLLRNNQLPIYAKGIISVMSWIPSYCEVLLAFFHIYVGLDWLKNYAQLALWTNVLINIRKEFQGTFFLPNVTSSHRSTPKAHLVIEIRWTIVTQFLRTAYKNQSHFRKKL